MIDLCLWKGNFKNLASKLPAVNNQMLVVFLAPKMCNAYAPRNTTINEQQFAARALAISHYININKQQGSDHGVQYFILQKYYSYDFQGEFVTFYFNEHEAAFGKTGFAYHQLSSIHYAHGNVDYVTNEYLTSYDPYSICLSALILC